MRVLPLFLTILLAVPAESRAADASSEGEKPPTMEGFSRIRGLFDVDLPETVRRYDVKFLVHPHFGDFTHRSYVRIPLGVRVGINDRTEINGEVETYLTHGLKAQHEGYGFYAVHLGMKYEWQHWLKSLADASIGFNSTMPVSRPPAGLTDGYNHFQPYIVFSREWEELPHFAPFVRFGADLISKSSVPGALQQNEPASNAIGVSPGFVYDLNTLKYTLVVDYSTTSIVGTGNHQYLSVNPSILWQLPPALTFHSSGTWVVGLGLKWSNGPAGADFGTSVKLRGEFDFKRLLAPLRGK